MLNFNIEIVLGNLISKQQQQQPKILQKPPVDQRVCFTHAGKNAVKSYSPLKAFVLTGKACHTDLLLSVII